VLKLHHGTSKPFLGKYSLKLIIVVCLSAIVFNGLVLRKPLFFSQLVCLKYEGQKKIDKHFLLAEPILGLFTLENSL